MGEGKVARPVGYEASSNHHHSEKVEESAFGKFGWVADPEGNRIELWEPPAQR